jgi:predicted glycogen debranching enzyme
MRENKEFLLTNGTGSYSSSTFLSGNTRKYHGLLVAALPDLTRVNVLNRLHETITAADKTYELTSSTYEGGVTKPDNKILNPEITLGTFPEWKFKLDGITISKTYMLLRDINCLKVVYKINTEVPLKFKIQPLVTYRNMHELRRFSDEFVFKQMLDDEGVLIEMDPGKFLRIIHSGFEYEQKAVVYKNFFYSKEKERGYDCSEDLINTGTLSSELQPGEHELQLCFNFFSGREPGLLSDREENIVILREHELLANFHDSHHLERTRLSELLVKQSDQFIFSQNDSAGIIAGYHWFDDWGRDTMISFKGLLLDTNRTYEAKAVLERWLKLFKDGFLPNRPFASDYNSLDAVLWFAYALWSYHNITGDSELVRNAIPKLEQVIEAFSKGSRRVNIDARGFLNNSNAGSSWTWMDAQVGGKPVTPRSGSPVEIQALWYNFLKIVLYFKVLLNDRTYLAPIRKLTAQLERNFEKTFWNETNGCLYDTVNEDSNDPSIRPNQLIALYLPYQLLGRRKAKRLLFTCEQELFCPAGMYSLAKSDQAFKGQYQGDQTERDLAYHQGTIWPFLIGYYLIALLHNDSKPAAAKKKVAGILNDFYALLEKHDLSYVPELFDPESMNPEGCISQAWSVALLIEVIVELAKA